MDIILRLGSEGKSVLVSSHVLHEVQSLTPNIVLLNRGRLVAEGHVRQIRDLIDKHPHHIGWCATSIGSWPRGWWRGTTWKASACCRKKVR